MSDKEAAGLVSVTIHRGTHQIGGSIAEIYTENTHIFIDFGSELNAAPENSTDAEMIGMMRRAKCDAVLFTHYHGDHIGLIEHIPEKDVRGTPIRLGMGATARRVLVNIHQTLADEARNNAEEKSRHEAYLALLHDGERWIGFEDGKEFRIGDFAITPIMVDHSAYDAYLFLIRAEGKTIVHTGDFRTRGRLGRDFWNKLSAKLAGVDVDVLITEGTMMSRPGEKVLTETQLQKKATEVLKNPENKYAFLICSSTNVESLASFASAAMYLHRPFLVNYYVYGQIELYRETAGANDKRFDFRKTYQFEDMRKYNPKLGMTQVEFMRQNGFLMLIGTSDAYDKRINAFWDDDPLLIYSMWDGYVKKGADTYDEALGRQYYRWPENRRVRLHTSGHATADDIRRMILTVKPQKYILPIHTEKPERFRELDIGEYAEKIKNVNDSEKVEVQ